MSPVYPDPLVTRDKTFTMLGEVGMANESTKTTQTSVRMAQHNEQGCMTCHAHLPNYACTSHANLVYSLC